MLFVGAGGVSGVMYILGSFRSQFVNLVVWLAPSTKWFVLSCGATAVADGYTFVLLWSR